MGNLKGKVLIYGGKTENSSPKTFYREHLRCFLTKLAKDLYLAAKLLFNVQFADKIVKHVFRHHEQFWTIFHCKIFSYSINFCTGEKKKATKKSHKGHVS